MSQCLNPECVSKNSQDAQFCQQCGVKLLLANRYRAIRMLGSGGFGRTFLSVDEFKPSKPTCVIKQFLPITMGGQKKAAKLFAQEAIRLDELGQHQQIPELLAYFVQDNRQYLIQEYIDGRDLEQELKHNGVFNEQQIRELLDDMLSVLQFVHGKNVIHRDIKPANIIKRKDDGKLFLVDFGAAKSIEGIDLSITGTVIGSAAYIAPEQAVGKAKFASDLYSLGATCLYLLTNQRPTELFDVAEGEWKWRDYLGNNQISYELGRVLDKLIEGATKRRFQTAEEVIKALKSGFTGVAPSITAPRSLCVSQKNKYQSLSRSKAIAPRTKSYVPTVTTPKQRTSISNLALKSFSFEVVTTVENSGLLISNKPFITFETQQKSAKYITLELAEGVTLDLIGIRGNKFIMGSPDTEAERGKDESQHEVRVRPFFLGKYPVTQAQWQAVMGNNPSRFTGNSSEDLARPVERVSWYDAIAFCQKLSSLVDRQVRLPSEAEWEYACRGGTKTPFHFGTTISTELANYNGEFSYGRGKEGEYRGETTKVGSFSANNFGLYDLHGNVAEWCADEWRDRYEGAPTDGSAWTSNNPKNARVLRGGSWLHLPGCCRSSHRLNAPPNSKSDAFGFRIAASL